MKIKDQVWDEYKAEQYRLIELYEKRIKWMKKFIKEMEQMEKEDS